MDFHRFLVASRELNKRPIIKTEFYNHERTSVNDLEYMNLYQWCPGAESNRRHKDFQSFALPTELPGRFEYNEFLWCPGAESNRRHKDFQSFALPTELPGQTSVKEFVLNSISRVSSITNMIFNSINRLNRVK